MNLLYRPYDIGDENAISELFEKAFGRPLSTRYWFWRFRDNPAGKGIVELAWDGDTLAGHYAVTTVRMHIGGKQYLAGLSGTTMTHPNYRGMGLFPKLANRCYQRMAEAELLLAWGFPNIMSHRGFVADLNWVDIHELPTFRFTINDKTRLPAQDSHVISLDNFDVRFDRLWDRVKEQYPVIVCRDVQHLTWRYLKNPQDTYFILAHSTGDEIDGYAIYKRYEDELQIVDILTEPDPQIGLSLVAKIVEQAQIETKSSISLWLNFTHPLHRALEKFGFVNDRPVTYFGARVLKRLNTDTDVFCFNNWHITMGDSDVY